MVNEKLLAKMEKAVAKKKSAPVLKMLKKADNETLIAILGALSKIADEDSCNNITHYLDNADAAVRTAACEAGLVINTEYMRTRVRHQLSQEQDPEVKAKIQDAFNKARKVTVTTE